MEENPSRKHVKTMIENRRRWVSLPDDIHQNIISRIDFPQNSVIVFSDTFFKIQILEWKPGLWIILDNLFTIFCSHSITHFSLHLHSKFYKQPCSSTILHSWSRLLRARNNVQHLSLHSFTGIVRQLLYPPTIFRIHSLVSLDLHSCIIDEIPLLVSNPITLPKLKKLDLGLIHCYPSLDWILRFCPSLEYLSLTIEDVRTQQEGNKNGPLLITGNNLKQLFLHLQSRSIIEVTVDAPQLEDFHYTSYGFILMQMFDSISHVKSLDLSIGGIAVRHYNSPTKTIFPNLARLQLYFSFNTGYEVFEAIVSMLEYCPNLDVLKLEINSMHIIWIPKVRFAPIIEHVKLITLRTCSSVHFDEDMCNLVAYLLRSAPVLEKLVIVGYDIGFADKSDKAQFRQTVLQCPKASSSCEIEFSRGYQLD